MGVLFLNSRNSADLLSTFSVPTAIFIYVSFSVLAPYYSSSSFSSSSPPSSTSILLLGRDLWMAPPELITGSLHRFFPKLIHVFISGKYAKHFVRKYEMIFLRKKKKRPIIRKQIHKQQKKEEKKNFYKKMFTNKIKKKFNKKNLENKHCNNFQIIK